FAQKGVRRARARSEVRHCTGTGSRRLPVARVCMHNRRPCRARASTRIALSRRIPVLGLTESRNRIYEEVQMPETFIHSKKFTDVHLHSLDDDATVGDLAAAVDPGAQVWLEGA